VAKPQRIENRVIIHSVTNVCFTLKDPLERTVLAREHLNNWHRLEIYYLAKTIADLPFEVIKQVENCASLIFIWSL